MKVNGKILDHLFESGGTKFCSEVSSWTTSGNGFGTFVKAHHFLNLFFDFIQQNPAPPCLTAEELTFLIIYLVATLKFGKK